MITVRIQNRQELVSDDPANFSFIIDEKNEQVLVKHKEEELGVLNALFGAKIEELKNIVYK